MREIDKRWQWLLLCSIAIFFILNFFYSTKFWKDEIWYLFDAKLFIDKGMSLEFIRGVKGPPGPLYGIFHGIFSSIFNYNIIATRVLNLVLFSGYLFFTARTISLIQSHNSSENDLFKYELIFLSLPVMSPIWGTAITEAPALLFLSLGIYFLIKSQLSKFDEFEFYLSAVLLSISFVGRQNLLAVLIFIPYLWIGLKRPFLKLFAYGIIAISLPFTMFWAWGGIIPPAVEFVGKGLNFFHLILGFAYAAVCFYLLKIESLWKDRKLIALVASVCIVLSFLFFDGNRIPMKGLATSLLPAKIVPLYAKFTIGLFCSLGLVFFKILTTEFKRSSHIQRLFIIIHVMPLITTIKINHLFSGRYIAASTPLIIYTALKGQKLTLSLMIRLALGMLLGIATLFMYYKRAL